MDYPKGRAVSKLCRMQSLGGGTPALLAVAAHLYTLQVLRRCHVFTAAKPSRS